MVKCFTFLGGKKKVDKSKIFFRPAVYGIILQGNNILVAKTKHTARYALPGGGADMEELETALHREVKEETGIEIEIKDFLHFNENYFYYDPSDDAFDSYQYFYLCRPVTTELAFGDAVDDLEAGDPEWVNIAELDEKNFQGVEMGILRIIKNLNNEKHTR